MEPRPEKPSPSPRPAPKPAAARPSRPSRAEAAKAEIRHQPHDAQEAALTPGVDFFVETPAIRGVPKGTSSAQLSRALAEAARGTTRTYVQAEALGAAHRTFGATAGVIEGYLPRLIDNGGRRHYDAYIVQARGDHAQYRNAEAAAVAVVPMWAAASGVTAMSDLRYDAATRALAAAGLAWRDRDGADAEIDGAAVVSESQEFAAGLGRRDRRVAMPRVDGGGVKDAILRLQVAALQTNADVATLHALLLDWGASDAQAEIDDATSKRELLGSIADFVVSVAGFIEAPGPEAGLGVGKAGADLFGRLEGPDALEAEVLACAGLAADARERAVWNHLVAGLRALRAAQAEVVQASRELDEGTAATNRELHNEGADADRSAGRELEHHAAIGDHLGKILEARRFVQSAQDAWGAVGPVVQRAAALSGQAAAGHRGDGTLAAAKEGVRGPASDLSDLAALRALVAHRQAQRGTSLEAAAKTVVSSLTPHAEAR